MLLRNIIGYIGYTINFLRIIAEEFDEIGYEDGELYSFPSK